MWWAIDLLASEYGGGVAAIRDEVYLDELLILTEKINNRRVETYLNQAFISTYAHMDKKGKREFVRRLDELRSQKRANKTKLDKTGMEVLKFAMGQGSRIVVK